MFSVVTAGGMPPPQDRIVRFELGSESSKSLTPAATSSGVPAANRMRKAARRKYRHRPSQLSRGIVN